MNSSMKIFFSNIQGIGSGDKMATLAGRTDGQDILVLNEVNKRVGSESAIKVRTPDSGVKQSF